MKPTRYKCLWGIALAMLLAGNATAQDDNDDPVAPEEPIPTVRLSYQGPNNAQRQLLLGFVGPPCTDGIDPGYDSLGLFTLPEDAYFWVNQQEVFIQGVGNFDPAHDFALGFKSVNGGEITLSLVETQNFDPQQPILLYDNQTGLVHDLKTASMTVTLQPGASNDRFSMFFTDAALGMPSQLPEAISVRYHPADRSLALTNPTGFPATLSLYGLDGRQAATWNALSGDANLAMDRFANGVYVVQIATTGGVVRRKIAIR